MKKCMNTYKYPAICSFGTLKIKGCRFVTPLKGYRFETRLVVLVYIYMCVCVSVCVCVFVCVCLCVCVSTCIPFTHSITHLLVLSYKTDINVFTCSTLDSWFPGPGFASQDISDEFKEVIESIKGDGDKCRCVLNKAPGPGNAPARYTRYGMGSSDTGNHHG